MKKIVLGGILLIGLVCLLGQANQRKQNMPDVGVKTESSSSWADGRDDLKSRLESLKMPALKEEGFAVHTHQHLDIFIKGEKIDIPIDIGVGPREDFIAQIHTHDRDGIIHVESPTVEKFYLGQFFDIWGVKLDENCINNYCADGENKLEVYSNGTKITGNPRDLELLPRQEIAIVYGSEADAKVEIPSSYDFPKDL